MISVCISALCIVKTDIKSFQKCCIDDTFDGTVDNLLSEDNDDLVSDIEKIR